MTTQEIIKNSVKAKSSIMTASSENKNKALQFMADALELSSAQILQANKQDLADAREHISDVMLDRLRLNEKRISDMAEGIRNVASLPDPVGKVLKDYQLENGLNIRNILVPMGVIAVIYESRPNVTSDAAALCLKAGSACILRGGKEAHRSAEAIVSAMRIGLRMAGLDQDIISLVDDTTRNSASELMTASGKIDLLIPRGGAGLIRNCVENAKVPVIQTGTGICHIYINQYADLEKGIRILENAKCSRPSVCNAAEVCLVDEAVCSKFLPKMYDALVTERQKHGLVPVRLKLDAKSAEYIKGEPAGSDDFDTEFLDYVLAVKTVQGVKEACEHIALHSTGHSEAIITENEEEADYFVSHVDSAAVYVNASTRFTDGGVFGLGCEIGISTQKLHARGPLGLEEICTNKYVITGNGNIRN